MAEGQINPWVRANLHTYDPETFAIVRDQDKPDYVRIMSRIAIADEVYQEAYLERQGAYGERDAFFAGQLNLFDALPDNVVQLRLPEDPEPLVA